MDHAFESYPSTMATIILIATIVTFVLGVTVYVMYKVREYRDAKNGTVKPKRLCLNGECPGGIPDINFEPCKSCDWYDECLSQENQKQGYNPCDLCEYETCPGQEGCILWPESKEEKHG